VRQQRTQSYSKFPGGRIFTVEDAHGTPAVAATAGSINLRVR